MRKDDWIQELYYKELSDKSRNNKDSGNTISSEKEIPPKQNQSRNRRCSKNFKTILSL